MNKKTLLYRNINDKLLKKMSVEISGLSFFNKDFGSIDYVNEDGNIILKDEDGTWTPQKYLKVFGNLIINNPKSCFEEENKIALIGTCIGIAMKVIINNTIYETMQIGTFDYQTKTVDVKFEKIFNDEEILNHIRLDFFLYLNDMAETNLKDLSFANEQGMIYGLIDCLYIVVDGNGSNIPVNYVKYNKNDPLWKLDFEYENMFVDRFDECFCLKINTEHEAFKYLTNPKSNPNFNRTLLNEIIVESLLIVINEVNEKDGLDFSETFEDGSVAQFIRYLCDDVLEGDYNIENQKDVSYKLRKQYTMR